MKAKITAIVLIIAIVAVFSVAFWGISAITQKDYVITVTEKERVQTGESSKYLIWGNDNDGNLYVFENVDSLVRFKFNSSDVYGEIEIGTTYRMTVVGFRIPFLSMYQNIITATPLYN